jgi:dolichol-phosphate mannosyltransferase
VADELAVRHAGRVHVLHRLSKEGIGPAYVSGFKFAIANAAKFIAQMDADHSHHPEDLPRLVAAAASHDLVIGSRYVPAGRTIGWSPWRRLLSRFGNLYARVILGVPIADLTGGFKVFRREVLVELDLDTIQANGYAFQIETTYRVLKSGKRAVELPIVFTDRVAGDSKLSHHIMLEAVRVVWRLRLQKTVPH